VITISELLQGVHRAEGARRARREAFVEGLFATVEPLSITPTVARVHAYLLSYLVRRGKTVGANDLWIGATAVVHRLGLVTLNVRDFERIPGLRVVAA
jgi:tRNA(fMet)-specific endonuclease VapC